MVINQASFESPVIVRSGFTLPFASLSKIRIAETRRGRAPLACPSPPVPLSPSPASPFAPAAAAPAGIGGDHDVVNRIDRDAAGPESGIRPFNDADRSDVSIRFTREDQQLVALRHIDFTVHPIDGDGLRVLQSRMGTLNLTNAGYVHV